MSREAGPRAEAQVDRADLLTLARPPDAAEKALASDFFRSGGRLHEFCLALLNLNEFLYVD